MTRETVLITGATGFIGSHVIERLLSDEEYNVIAIVRRATNYKNTDELRRRGVLLIEGNFCDRRILEETFGKFRIKCVIHLAALRGVGKGSREDLNNVNVLGTTTLLEYSLRAKIQNFIFCSSVGVFGTIPKELPGTLNTQLRGDNDYHRSKILAENEVKKYLEKGLNGYIVRPTITYGIGDDGFSKILVNMIKKRILFLPVKDVKIHLLDVAKLADLIARLVNIESLPQRTFIVADEAPISLRELANLTYLYHSKKAYPSFFRLPNGFLHMLTKFFELFQNEKWATRLLLISRSWYYDISETIRVLHYKPAQTRDSFIKAISDQGSPIRM